MPYLTRDATVRGPDTHVDFSPTWAVSSMFGGALAAAAVRATRPLLGARLGLRTGLFAYLAPTPSGPAIIRVKAHRVGRRHASASVSIESGGTETVHAMLTFAADAPTARDAEGAAPTPGPHHRAFDGATEWVPTPGTDPGTCESWLRAAGSATDLSPDEWTCIAADLLGPAAARLVARPFTVATASLAITVTGRAEPSAWQHQSVVARVTDGWASGELELRDAGGALIARAHQEAALLPATAADLPRSVTAFADSSHDSRMIGMN